MHYTVTVPWPHGITANHIWRKSGRGGFYLPPEVIDYRNTVWAECRRANARTLHGPVRIEVEAYPPDHRRRDLDNLLKPVLDAMTYAGAWADDVQVADLRVVRKDFTRPGKLIISWNDIDGRD